MKIYVIRHGLVPSNQLKIINGQSRDESLVEEGIQEVKNALSNIPQDISRIYCSDMLRTKQTADILNEKLNLNISYHPELREVNFGDLNGKTWSEHNETYGNELHQSYINQVYDFHPYNGESFEDVKSRVISFINSIKANHSEDESILLVAHGGIIRLLHNTFKGGPFEPAKNVEIREFTI
jgi:broad specificity phosphatase PhoE